MAPTIPSKSAPVASHGSLAEAPLATAAKAVDAHTAMHQSALASLAPDADRMGSSPPNASAPAVRQPGVEGLASDPGASPPRRVLEDLGFAELGAPAASLVDCLRTMQRSFSVSPSGRYDAATREAVRLYINDLAAQLSRLNLYRGASDGTFSPELRASVAAFQRAHGLDPCGRADHATVARLAEVVESNWG